jgi:tripartite-type tricarboxylate transporter receptor subunit TctC
VLPYIRSGDLRALAVTTRERSPLAPEVPTLHELGYTGYEALDLLALFGPAGTPMPILRRLNAACAAAVAVPEVREKLDALGVVPMVQPPEAFAAHAVAESAKWREMIL